MKYLPQSVVNIMLGEYNNKFIMENQCVGKLFNTYVNMELIKPYGLT